MPKYKKRLQIYKNKQCNQLVRIIYKIIATRLHSQRNTKLYTFKALFTTKPN